MFQYLFMVYFKELESFLEAFQRVWYHLAAFFRAGKLMIELRLIFALSNEHKKEIVLNRESCGLSI